MKVVVQRVTRAKVTVGDREVSRIGKGLLVLLGITRDDTPKESEWMARKLLNLRMFENPEKDNKLWDCSVKDLNLELLCVSQFTLCHVLKGNKPDFHDALTSEQSGPIYSDFLKLLGSMYKPEAIKGGEFGTVVQVHIQNDGPTTLQFETPNIPTKSKERKPQNASKKGAESTKKETPAAVSGVESEKEETAIASAAAASSGDN